MVFFSTRLAVILKFPYLYTVKLANSTSPFKFRQVKFPQKNVKKLVLILIKCVFLKEKLDPIDTVYEKHILSFSRPACRGILTWWNLEGLAELANLTVREIFFLFVSFFYVV